MLFFFILFYLFIYIFAFLGAMKYQTNVFGLLTFSVLVVSASRDRIINKERNNDGEGKFVII